MDLKQGIQLFNDLDEKALSLGLSEKKYDAVNEFIVNDVLGLLAGIRPEHAMHIIDDCPNLLAAIKYVGHLEQLSVDEETFKKVLFLVASSSVSDGDYDMYRLFEWAVDYVPESAFKNLATFGPHIEARHLPFILMRFPVEADHEVFKKILSSIDNHFSKLRPMDLSTSLTYYLGQIPLEEDCIDENAKTREVLIDKIYKTYEKYALK